MGLESELGTVQSGRLRADQEVHQVVSMTIHAAQACSTLSGCGAGALIGRFGIKAVG